MEWRPDGMEDGWRNGMEWTEWNGMKMDNTTRTTTNCSSGKVFILAPPHRQRHQVQNQSWHHCCHSDLCTNCRCPPHSCADARHERALALSKRGLPCHLLSRAYKSHPTTKYLRFILTRMFLVDRTFFM